ncbi:MBL fold metallo-hydrolase, partial [Eubacteriales bacterium OttesenSCG-928-K08]|nr:MBL fold metallo-hydrolase [Eubacteriales bacterium OttesenSCG-928-K08]
DVFPAYAGLDALIEWDEQVEIRILSPFDGYEYDLNNASVVCRVKFGETSVLLTGDAEIPAEKIALNELPASYFSATILKMGHHGSSTSTGAALFDAVKPEAAFMSLGEDNSYGHPHREIIELLNGAKIPYYRTDESGIIHFTLDGTGWSVKTEK